MYEFALQESSIAVTSNWSVVRGEKEQTKHTKAYIFLKKGK